MSEKKKIEELSKKLDNTDTLITFGEEAITFRKDDKRSVEALKRIKQEHKERRIEAIKSGEMSLFEGINLKNERAEDETHQQYKDRLYTNKSLQKLYNILGREEAIRRYPEGFAQALLQEMEKIEDNKNE
tara:strand:- start:175 stop:564 length:390 start_codon:yes stop_codon:yes gene_type:complete